MQKKLQENKNCDLLGNSILDLFGMGADVHPSDSGTCRRPFDTLEERVDMIIEQFGDICGRTANLPHEPITLEKKDRARLPWLMFARDLPIGLGKCVKGDPNFTKPYLYVEYDATERIPPEVGLCACRSQRGSRDCYRETEGQTDRCALFSGKPMRYGSILQYNDKADLKDLVRSVQNVVDLMTPIFALFSVLVWTELPATQQDKMDLRLSARMKLDLLDSFLFYLAFIRKMHTIDKPLPSMKYFLPDVAWHNFHLNVWCFAWVSAYVWMAIVTFLRILDEDPDKTPKTWKSAKDILHAAEVSVDCLEPVPKVVDPYDVAVRQQSYLYQKEFQKLIKKRTVVDILDEDVDAAEAQRWEWRRHLIVFSEPKVKDLGPEAFESDDAVFKLYVIAALPGSRQPDDPDVWLAESWQEYVLNRSGGPNVTPDEVGIECLEMTFEDVLTRVRPAQGYLWLDCRYLGCCSPFGCQPTFEYRKMKEDDCRVLVKDRIVGFSETYWNKYQYDWWERRIEFISVVRSLAVDVSFFFARVMTGLWIGGFDSWFTALLLMKNFMFGVLGVMYILACGNPKHKCGFLECSPFNLIATCIERTKLGTAIKLGVLMPLRISIECISCGFRAAAEYRLEYCSKRMRMLIYQRSKRSADNAEEISHEIRLLASRVQEHMDTVEMLDLRRIVNMKAKVKAKDVFG